MAIGAFFFLLGTLGTGLTYVMAEPGDEYLLLYGAIAGGLVGFLRGLRSWRQSPSASFPTLLVGIAGALPVLFIAGIYVKASWDRAAGRERVAQMLREEQERRGVDTAGTDAAPDPISAYIVVLKNAQDPAARREAVWRLGEMRQGARDAAPELLAALRDPHPRVRAGAVEALLKVAPKDQGVMTALKDLFGDPSGDVWGVVLRELGGRRDADALAALRAKLDEPKARGPACAVLGTLRDQPDFATPLILSQVADENHEVRSACARALGQLGNATPEVVQTLETMSTSDLHRWTQQAAAQALAALQRARP
jgi:hypothetical protein